MILHKDLLKLIGRTDIYLIDQILKGRYLKSDLILDAGCGHGRNLSWFMNQGIEFIGLDKSAECINKLQRQHPQFYHCFQMAGLEKIPYVDHYFDHVISSAVLHFSTSEDHFWELISEHLRVLKKEGSLFIRMTSDIGIENKSKAIGKGVFLIPDGSTRFLITRPIVNRLISKFSLIMEEPLKTTNVSDIRCMTTIVLRKT